MLFPSRLVALFEWGREKRSLDLTGMHYRLMSLPYDRQSSTEGQCLWLPNNSAMTWLLPTLTLSCRLYRQPAIGNRHPQSSSVTRNRQPAIGNRHPQSSTVTRSRQASHATDNRMVVTWLPCNLYLLIHCHQHCQWLTHRQSQSHLHQLLSSTRLSTLSRHWDIQSKSDTIGGWRRKVIVIVIDITSDSQSQTCSQRQ